MHHNDPSSIGVLKPTYLGGLEFGTIPAKKKRSYYDLVRSPLQSAVQSQPHPKALILAPKNMLISVCAEFVMLKTEL